jgi:hypothetical protein
LVTTSGSPAGTLVEGDKKPEAEQAPSRPAGRLLRSGWPPAAAVAAVAVLLLLAFETPALDIVRFAAYVGYGLALPGTLLYRALRGTPRSFLEDVAIGTVLGYAVELLIFFVVSALGAPILVAAWPAVVVVTFLAVPRLRRHWRPTGAPPMPAGWSWAVAAMCAVALCWLAWSGFLNHAITGPSSDSPYVDVPFHLALVGELRHHFPPKTPWVTGEPVSYHWFVHAHMAASTWATGVEAHIILLRLFAVPLVVLSVVLTAILGTRIAGRLWAGPVAAALYVLVGSFHPFSWGWFSTPYTDTSFLLATLWGSPTQTFGLTVFLPVVLLLADRLRHEPGGLGQWVVIAFLLAATVGGKATFLPLLLGGLGLAGLISLIVRRRIERPLIIATCLAFAGFLYAQLVLFGGSSAGLKFDLSATARIVASDKVNPSPQWFLIFMIALTLLSWSARAAGVVGLFARRDRWLNPVAGVLMGIVGAGIAVTFAFGQSGGAQLYFARSITPFIAVLSAWGAAMLLPAERATRRMAFALVGAAVLGAAVSTAVVLLGDELMPTAARLGRRGVALHLLTPYAIVLGVFAALAVALLLLRRRHEFLRGVSAVLLLAFVFGLGASRLIPGFRDPVRSIVAHGGLAYVKGDSLGRPIAPGGVEAARWVRDHSDPDELLATNTHCRLEVDGRCDHRHFWIAAFAERHVLVESWGYTASASKRIPEYKGVWYYLPYWNSELLADNDRLFSDPTKANADRLREHYGVRWLVVDERFDPPAPGLGDVAKERFRAGDTVVYELTE